MQSLLVKADLIIRSINYFIIIIKVLTYVWNKRSLGCMLLKFSLGSGSLRGRQHQPGGRFTFVTLNWEPWMHSSCGSRTNKSSRLSSTTHWCVCGVIAAPVSQWLCMYVFFAPCHEHLIWGHRASMQTELTTQRNGYVGVLVSAGLRWDNEVSLTTNPFKRFTPGQKEW